MKPHDVHLEVAGDESHRNGRCTNSCEQNDKDAKCTHKNKSILPNHKSISLKHALGVRHSTDLTSISATLSILSSKEQRAIRTLIIVFTIFVICWFPFFTLQLIAALSVSNKPFHNYINDLMFDFAWPGYITSGLNPIIYAVFSVEFRRAFRSSFCSNDEKIRLRNVKQKKKKNVGIPESHVSTIRKIDLPDKTLCIYKVKDHVNGKIVKQTLQVTDI